MLNRTLTWALAAGILLGMSVSGLQAQSGSQGQNPPPKPPPSSEDNPFPGDAPQAPAPQNPAAGQSGQSKPDASKPDGSKPDANGAPAKKESDNPFPGEDPNAPIIPVNPGPVNPGTASPGPVSPRPAYHPGPASGSGSDSGEAGRRDPDGDPVRSPDLPGHHTSEPGGDDGFSSSLSGVNASAPPEGGDETADNAAANAVPRENVKEDVNVGQFYLEQKNWKAAQVRFAAAFAGDAENVDAVWGLAEAERHLRMFKEADQHYKLFLSYDPTGPHGKAARKALEEVEAALVSQPSAKK